jgi:hypothetical protein
MLLGRRSETGKIPLIWFLVAQSTFLLKISKNSESDLRWWKMEWMVMALGREA